MYGSTHFELGTSGGECERYPWERSPRYPLNRKTGDLDAMEKRNISCLRWESNIDSLVKVRYVEYIAKRKQKTEAVANCEIVFRLC
jgi:hypothetical protein